MGSENKIIFLGERKMNERRKLLLGLGATSAMTVWHKPLVNAVVLPAHATGSPPPPPSPPTTPPPPPPPPPPPVQCPSIVIGDVQSSALSGAGSATSCGISFEIFSTDPAIPLTITVIDAAPIEVGVEVTNDGLGDVTSEDGVRVTWTGPIVGSAADCANLADIVPLDDVTFTISATCAIDGSETIPPADLVLTLTDIIGGATGA